MKKRDFCGLFVLPFASLLLACSSSASPATPGLNGYKYEKKSPELMRFESSDRGLDDFLNDYFKRHVGYVDEQGNDWNVHSKKTGVDANLFFWQEWQAQNLYYFNSYEGLESNRIDGIRHNLSSIPVDRYGYVWGSSDGSKWPQNRASGDGEHEMGWPIPNASYSGGKGAFYDFSGFDNGEWTSNFGASYWKHMFVGNTNGTLSRLEFVSPLGTASAPLCQSFHSPFIEVDTRFYTSTPENIEDLYFYFKTDPNQDWDESRCVSFSSIAETVYPFSGVFEKLYYLPMYASSSWNSLENHPIYQMKVEVRAKPGKTLSGRFGLNHVRSMYDTRHFNNNAEFIDSLYYDYSYTGDLDYLSSQITRARKAMNFMLQAYDSSRGLLDQSYMIGHDGNNAARAKEEKVSHSLNNGYWDLFLMGKFDFQTNLYFYKALRHMAALEEMVSGANAAPKGEASVKTANKDVAIGYGEAAYSYDPASLRSIADQVLAALRAPTNDAKQTGFFDEKNGRFIAGYSAKGEPIDLGYTMWNEEAITLGVATEEQAKQILSWIDGSRTIEGDKSTGADIYRYSFAPRITTKEQAGLFSGLATYNSIPTYDKEDFCYGGAALFTSYYDLLARLNARGASDAFARLKAIQAWYEPIRAYFEANKDTMEYKDFYWSYYRNQLDITPSSGYRGYKGIVGLDSDFIHNLLLISAIPYGFFGMQGGSTCLRFAPSMPDGLNYWKIENLSFHHVKYDVTITKNGLEIDAVRGNAEGLSCSLSLPAKSAHPKVYVNGKETTEFALEQGRVNLTIPFQSGSVEVR